MIRWTWPLAGNGFFKHPRVDNTKGRWVRYEDAAAAVKEARELAKEQHQIILMLLDQTYGMALIDRATQENHSPNRVISWWKDERKFLHIIIDGEES